MSKKIGRNDPCWCGSGKKLKKCHLNRGDETPLRRDEILAGSRKAFAERLCLHPDAGPENCQGDIVRAHTVQRNGSLSVIARAGHVYALPNDLGALFASNGRLTPRLVGVGKASTFTGFCALHDESTFAPVEKVPFSATPQQILLLVFRTISRHLFAKRGHDRNIELLRLLDRGRDDVDQQVIQKHASDTSAGIELALQELNTAKSRCDGMLASGDYSSLRYVVVHLDRTPDVLVSGMTQPERDFAGNELQDLADLSRPAQWITVSALAAPHGGAFLFAWLDPNPVAESFVRSLMALSVDRIPDAIVRLVFEEFENLYWSPTWWDALPTGHRALLERRIHSGMPIPLPEYEPPSLNDDGVTFVSWRITKVTTNLDIEARGVPVTKV